MTAHDLIIEVSQQLPGVSMQDFFSVLKRRVNNLYKLWRWRHYETDYQFEIKGAYSTGTVSVTNGATAVTGTDTVWTSDHVGWKIMFAGSEHWYTVEAVGSNTSITLVEDFYEDTLTDATYTLYQDEYDVPSDFDRLKSLENMDTDYVYTSEDYFLFEEDKIRFYDYPTDDAALLMYYRKKPTHATTPASTVDIPAVCDEVIVCAMLDAYMRRQTPIDPWLAHISMNKADWEKALLIAKGVDNTAGGQVTKLQRVAFK